MAKDNYAACVAFVEAQVPYHPEWGSAKGLWDAIGGDTLRPGGDLCVFDFAIAEGAARARNMLLRFEASKTASEIIHAISAHRLSFRHAMRHWNAFGAAYGRRVAACEATALRMAGAWLLDALKQAKSKANGYGSAGAAVAGAWGAAIFILQGAVWVTSVLSAGIVLTLAIMGFTRWRQGQRVDALTQAMKIVVEKPARQRSMIELMGERTDIQ